MRCFLFIGLNVNCTLVLDPTHARDRQKQVVWGSFMCHTIVWHSNRDFWITFSRLNLTKEKKNEKKKKGDSISWTATKVQANLQSDP